MKLSQLKVKLISTPFDTDVATTVAALEAAVNAFLSTDTQRTLIGEVRVLVEDDTYVAIVNYTE